MSAQFTKPDIAESFSRAAGSYDSVAELQRRVGFNLLDRIDTEVNPSGVILDLGCGTGFFGPELHQRYSPYMLLSLDLAEGMLNYAREHRATAASQWLCGDAESLPLADNSVDLIFSSLAIQWCENLPALFGEVARVLKPGGQFLFATLGPETLHELRSAWSAVDNYQHVNRFISLSTLKKEAGSHLMPGLLEQEYEILRYQQVRELTHELKGLGAHNISAGRQSGLTGKARVMAFKEAYEVFRTEDGILPATYQVFYGKLIKE